MITLYFVLLLLALVAFVLAAFQLYSSRINLIAVGLALWVAVPMIQMAQRL